MRQLENCATASMLGIYAAVFDCARVKSFFTHSLRALSLQAPEIAPLFQPSFIYSFFLLPVCETADSLNPSLSRPASRA